MVRKYVQGENTVHDRELFGLLGPWITSKAISEALGSPIHSEPGDIWHVVIDPAGAPLGFALTHFYKTTKSAHVRFLFVPAGTLKTQEALLHEVLAFARGHELKSVYTYDRKDGIWEKSGFKKHKKPRSTFYKWEKEL